MDPRFVADPAYPNTACHRQQTGHHRFAWHQIEKKSYLWSTRPHITGPVFHRVGRADHTSRMGRDGPLRPFGSRSEDAVNQQCTRSTAGG